MNYIRFTRLNPLEHIKDIKWGASENRLGTLILWMHADTNHKSSAIHPHIVQRIQIMTWTANQMWFLLPPSKKNRPVIWVPSHVAHTINGWVALDSTSVVKSWFTWNIEIYLSLLNWFT